MLRGTLYLFFGHVVFALTSFIFHGFIGRKLGPESYGVFGILNSIIVFNEIFFLRASYESISKYISEDASLVRSILNKGLMFQTILGILIGCSIFVFSSPIASLFRDDSLSIYIKMIAVLFPISALSSTYLGTLNGMRIFDKQCYVTIFFSISRLLFVIVFVYSGFGLKGLMFGLILSGLVQLYVSRSYCSPFKDRGSFSYSKLFSFMPQLMIISFLTAILMNIDIMAVKVILMNDRSTGYYTSATTISRLPYAFISSLTMTIFPFISNAEAKNDIYEINNLIIRAFRYIFIFILPIILLFIATSRDILVFVFGEQYIFASSALKILSFGIFLNILKVFFYNVIVASGRPKIVIGISFCSLIIDILLIYILSYKYNIIGIALASMITNGIGYILSLLYVTRRYNTKYPVYSLLKITGISLIIFIVASFISNSGVILPVNYIVVAIIYISMLFAIGEINVASLKDIREKYIKRFVNNV